MAGQTYTKLEVGDRCIIDINDVNSPTGWWWGIVDSFEWHDDHLGGWGKVEAHITGPFSFKADMIGNKPGTEPMYGDDHRKPSVNYNVFAADRDTVLLVRRLRNVQSNFVGKLREANIRNEELRSVLKGMALTPEKIVAAVREAVAKTP